MISITFKDVKGDTYQKLYHKLRATISNLYLSHAALLSSPKLRDAHKSRIEAFIDYTADEHMIEASLVELTSCLYQCYDVKPILLIDEYDAPIQAGYQYNYYEKAIQLVRGVLSPVLKNNTYLKKAVLTGVLRVAKEGMFSGLNNVKVYSILNHH